MCDYGVSERNLTLHETAVALKNLLMRMRKDTRRIVLGSYGSFFDPDEIPVENRNYILKMLSRVDVEQITIETHYETMEEDVLRDAAEQLRDKFLSYEVGLESTDTYVQEMCLNKIIDLKKLEEKIKLVHSYGNEIWLNILFGTPFLNPKERQTDTLETIRWAFKHGADGVILFPINIKPFTLLEELYKNGLYTPVSQWDFIELLNQIPEERLGRVTISWYGNRVETYDNYEFKPVLPSSCKTCRDAIMEFYEIFECSDSTEEKKAQLESIRKRDFSCHCRENARKKFETDTVSREKNVERAYSYLRTVLEDVL